MSNLFWLTEAQMARLRPFFPKSHGRPRGDDLRVLSGIIFINLNGLRWCDAPREYGPAKTLYNRWKRWSDNGVFARIMVGLAAKDTDPKTIMIDATYLKAHRTACSLRAKKGGAVARSVERKGSREKETVQWTVSPENGTQSCTPSPMRKVGPSGSRGIGPLDQPLILELMSAGQVSDYTGAAALLDSLPQADWFLADRGYDADWLRKALQDRGIKACIPGRTSRKKTIKYDKRRYKRRNRIEIMFGRLKDWRRVATRYDRCPETCLFAIALAATVLFWL